MYLYYTFVSNLVLICVFNMMKSISQLPKIRDYLITNLVSNKILQVCDLLEIFK